MKLSFTTIIFDWKRTLYNPDNKELIIDSKKVLKYFSNLSIEMHLIGKGGQEMYLEVERLGLAKYFKSITFVEESKTKEDFLSLIEDLNIKQLLVIGDRLKSEIEVGNSIGATTIWIKKGKFATETPELTGIEPCYTINSIEDVLELI
jgi:FMN phosphatase YigB (HAD superfamily)